MNVFSKVTLRSLMKNKTRTIVTIIGIILSVAMITAVTTSISSLKNYLTEIIISNDGDWHGQLGGLNAEALEEIKNDKRTDKVFTGNILGYAEVGTILEDKPYLYILGVDDGFEENMPIKLIEGRLPETSDEILLPEHLSETGNVKYDIGDTISLDIGNRYFDGEMLGQHNMYMGPDEENPDKEELVINFHKEYTVVGTYERPSFEDYSSPGYTALTKQDDNSPSDLYQVYYKLSNANEVYEFTEEYVEKYPESSAEVNTDLLIASGASSFENYYTVLYSLAAILMGLIMFGAVSLIYNAFSISISERTHQFGLLSSVGATRKQIRKMVFFEAFCVSLVGIPIGIISGIAGIGVTLHFIGDKFGAFIGDSEGIVFSLSVNAWSVIIACAVSIVTVLISAWVPSRRAMKVTAIEAIRLNNDINVRKKDVRSSKLVYKLFGLEGMLAEKNYKRSRKKYRATVLSLFMSVVLFISASSFCGYLTDSVETVQDYDYDISVSYYDINEDDVEETPDLNKIYTDLSSIEGVTQTGFSEIYTSYAQIPIECFSDEYLNRMGGASGDGEDDSGSIKTLVSLIGLQDDEFKQLAKAAGFSESGFFGYDGVLGICLSDVTFLNLELEKYETINLIKSDKVSFEMDADDTENGPKIPIDAYTAQVDPPYGFKNTSKSWEVRIYCPMSVFKEAVNDIATSYASMVFSAEDRSSVYEQVETYVDENDLDLYVSNTFENEENARNMVLIVNVFSYGFITLISLISMTNVFNTISTNILLRRREFAMLRSVGMTGRGLNKMMNFECLLYGTKSLIFGIPVSIGVTYLIYMSVKQGLSTHFYMPWVGITVAVISVFLVVFITMLYAMSKIKKDNTIDALRNENL